MPTQTQFNGQTTIPGTEEYLENSESEVKSTRRGNPLMRGLNPAMWNEPYMVDGPEPIMSDELCLEKGNKLLLEAMGLFDEVDWLEYCRRVFVWRQSANERKLNAEAELLAAQFRQNPDLLKLALAKIETDTEETATKGKTASSSKT